MKQELHRRTASSSCVSHAFFQNTQLLIPEYSKSLRRSYHNSTASYNLNIVRRARPTRTRGGDGRAIATSRVRARAQGQAGPRRAAPGVPARPRDNRSAGETHPDMPRRPAAWRDPVPRRSILLKRITAYIPPWPDRRRNADPGSVSRPVGIVSIRLTLLYKRALSV